MSIKNPKKIKKKCLICDKDISIFPSRIKDGKGKFCSKKCYAKWQSENRIGKNSYNWKGGEIEKQCVICNKVFYAIPARKDIRLTCSRKCLGKWHSKNIIKERVGSWKGGITPLIVKIRGCFLYRQWRSDIFTRDSFLCQECGKNGGIEAHHIKPFSTIIEENKIKTFSEAESCEELWNINNGVTLCIGCHDKK
jgi:5-methylcytosine-specific restriction endonuclease McrA